MSNLRLPPYQSQRSQRRSYVGFPSVSSAHTQSSSTFHTSFQLLVTAPTGNVTNTTTMAVNEKIPSGYIMMDHQVAGHTFQVAGDEIGMLKSIEDASVLKPGGSPMCAAREVKFYEQLLTTTDPTILQLRDFVPEYRGTQQLPVGSKTVNFIKMKDLTQSMLEPCIIDLKMGRRTWDPLASEQKREMEDNKYQDCKNTIGFCVPGFQTYHIASGTFKKFGKEYGKKLNQNTIKDGERHYLMIMMKILSVTIYNIIFKALRLFLNVEAGLCRQLIMQILTNLWAIQKWIRTQKIFQFYSSSVLIVYDARKLRQVLDAQKRNSSGSVSPGSGGGGISPVASSGDLLPPSFIRKSGSGDSINIIGKTPPPSPKAVYKKIQRSHSSTNNYEQV